jgi:NTE family protein
MADDTVLDSPVLGSGEYIRPCGDTLRPAEPERAPTGPTIGLTLSGGGFRATFAAFGIARYLADARLLSSVRFLSSVSGGSVANGVIAKQWPELRSRTFESAAFDQLVVDPVVESVSASSLKVALLTNVWRTIGRTTRTDVLGQEFEERFFGDFRLEQLDPQVRFVINAANLVTGVRFTFERDVVGDYVGGLAPTAGTDLRLSQAVAASASVPGAFAPWRVRGIKFPCATQDPLLLDGGVYDNTGLEVLDSDRHRNVFTATMNAGGLLRPGGYGRVPVVRDLARANSLLYRQSTSLRTRAMVTSFKLGRELPLDAELPAGARRGLLVGLSTNFGDDAGEDVKAWRAAFPEERSWQGRDLSLYPTVFDKLPEALCRRLVYRGWWLTGAAMAQYYPELAPQPTSLTAPPLDAGG